MTELPTATPLETAQSAAWNGPAPAVTVVVSTHNRWGLLGGLLDTLEAQDDPDFEVIVADNGSSDDTWSTLTTRCAETSMRMRAVRLDFHDGPAVPRNTCIAEARGELIAFTDDDCLPTPTWLSELTKAFEDRIDIVQGRTEQDPGGWAGPWGRTLNVTSPSGLFETANLAARRKAILAVGGFSEERLLWGRAFGEDVVLGSAIARCGGFRFAESAIVHHRVMPGRYRDFLEERARLRGFPLLVRAVPELRQRAFARVFLSRRTAVVDLALISVVVAWLLDALAGYSPWVHLLDLTFLLWFVAAWRDARARPGRLRVIRAAQICFADLNGAAALLNGSLHARRLLL